MDVKSVEVGRAESAGRKEAPYPYSVSGRSQPQTADDVLDILGVWHGGGCTLIAVEHPPAGTPVEPEEERKECARVERPHGHTDICGACGGPLYRDKEHCPHCDSHHSHTIPWSEFRKDC